MVDLPDPDGPTMAANSPVLIVTVTDRSAATGGDPGCSLLTPTSSSASYRRHCATTTRVPAVMPGPLTWTCPEANSPVVTPTRWCAPDGVTTSRP